MPVQPPPVPGTPGQAFATPIEPHTPLFGQVVGQSSAPPQPSPILPQYWPPVLGVQVIGTQFAGVHRFGRTAPQTWPVGHAPQLTVPPQPSPMSLQKRAPEDSHAVAGTQPSFTHRPFLLHDSPAA